MKRNNVIVALMSTFAIAGLVIMTANQSLASNANTPTTLGIRTGVLSFYKDTGSAMNTYFSNVGPNTSSSIDIGTYDASLSTIAAASSGDHRFTVSDMLGKAFLVQLVSSDLTALDDSGATLTIAKNFVSYTGTTRAGTGKALTAAPTSAADIGTTPVTFVQRNNHSGISMFSQEITLKVDVPAAQAPGAYTGLLTFTY